MKRSLLFGIPLLGGIFWRPLFLLVVPLLAAHFVIDARRAWAHRKELSKIGYYLRARDFLAFTLLNWAVPFVDAWRIARGYIADWGKTGPWKVPAAPA